MKLYTITHPKVLSLAILKKLSKYISDELYLRIKFYLTMGKLLHLRNPRTYNEKIQWLKLYGRTPETSSLCDKYAVKKIVSEKIGDKYVIPLIGVWNSPDEIDFDSLPNQFVLKCTRYEVLDKKHLEKPLESLDF